MNEMLIDKLAFDRYNSDIKCGVANYHRQIALAPQNSGPRFQLALALLSLATRIQPSLAFQLQPPAQPATA